MKIVHVLPALTKGGAERIVADLANRGAQAGHEVAIIAACPANSALLRNSLHPDVRVLFISDSIDARVGRYLSLLPWLWKHRVWLAEQDVIHCHLTYGAVFGTAVIIFRRLGRARRPTVVETYHAVGMPIPSLHRWLHTQLASCRDALVLVAEDDYWRMFLANRPGLLSEIIPNGISISHEVMVDPETRRSYRRKIGIPDECRFVIGAVGRMEPARRPWLYLPLFAEVDRVCGPGVHFVLAGGGAELQRMSALVAKYGLTGRVHLPGLVHSSYLPISIMDLYITLNIGPITGLAAMEAASSGVPVVAIQMLAGYRPGPSDWIWSSDEIAAVAGRVIALLRSDPCRETLAARQKSYVRLHRTTDAMSDSYHSLYRVAISRSRTA